MYLREGYVAAAWQAFLYGWMSAAVLDPGLAAALAMGAAPYVQSLMPVSARVLAWTPATILIGLALLNYVGTRLSGRAMATANLLKIAVLFCLVAWAWISGHATHRESPAPGYAKIRLSGTDLCRHCRTATVNAFFSFGGWWERRARSPVKCATQDAIFPSPLLAESFWSR